MMNESWGFGGGMAMEMGLTKLTILMIFSDGKQELGLVLWVNGRAVAGAMDYYYMYSLDESNCYHKT